MTENIENATRTGACLPLKRLSCLALSCSILVLSGCENIKLPSFSSEKETLNKETKELRDEISYTKEKKLSSAINPKNMFARTLRDDDERLDRLERAVQDMRNEFDSVQPSIQRLSSLEGEIQRLILELKTLNEEDMAPAPMAQKQKAYTPPAPKKSYTPPVKSSYQKKSPPPVTSGSASVYDLRVGEHSGRTRLVMDVNTKTSFNVDIDNAENIAVIEMPNAKWTAATSKSFAKSNFVSSYKVEETGDGSILILQLKRNAKVSYKDDLPGKSGSARRLVIDLIGA